VLVDTNVLLEATDEGRKLHRHALSVFSNAAEAGVDLFVATQVIREYLVVATRPLANNGLGMRTVSALNNIAQFRRKASLIAETNQASELFLKWAARFEICGKRLHDLQLLASGSVAGMNVLLTANEQDFPETGTIGILPLKDLKW
jgi:predicted nucleic acid-binding protein